MKKETYMHATKKKQVRDFLFSYFKFTKVVGLAGPDYNEYVKFCELKGAKDIEVWENDIDTIVHQLKSAKTPIKIKYGDILEAEADKRDVLYDLDFCCTPKYMREHIRKFNRNFIMTFSRRLGTDYTIKKFFRDRKEKILRSIVKSGPIPHTIFITNLGRYIYTPYWDTSAMCCIAKIK